MRSYPPLRRRVVGNASQERGAKDTARSEAIRRWPTKRVEDDGKAEAALIAVAGLRREAGQ